MSIIARLCKVIMSWDGVWGHVDTLMSDNDVETTELAHLIRGVIAPMLEDDATPPWSTVSDRYWHTVTAHIMTKEPDVVADIKELTQKIRTRFRTCAEHMHRVRMVTCTKSTESIEKESNGTNVCCVCLRPVQYTWQKTVRLKASDDDPTKCGHVLHAACATRLQPHEDDGYVRCPVCREAIGPTLRYWIDTESTVPQF